MPGHAESLLYPWQSFDLVPNVSIVDACATGGGMAFTFGESRQMRGGDSAGIHLERPTGPRGQIELVKLTVWYAARLAGTGQALRFWSGDVRSDGSVHPALSNAPPGSENVVADQQLSPDTVAVQLGVQCGPGSLSPAPCAAAHDAPLLIRGLEVTLSESISPIVSLPSGTLLDGRLQSGVRTLTYSASDRQSGLRKVDVLLDETLVASRDLSARCSYSDFTACPEAENETVQIDTRNVGNGPRRLKVRVEDAAGNERVVHGTAPVQVANEARSGSRAGYELIARFNGASRSTLTVPYGRRVSLRGRLTRGGQVVAPGTRMEVLERLDRRGAQERSVRRVATRADGSFSVGVATSRPSRTIRLAYRPPGADLVVSRALKLRVRAASQLRATLRGRTLRFSGKVLSAPIPRPGKRVLMEGRSPGSAWTAFKTLRTNRHGRFSGTYRLRVRRPGVLLKIRAVVPREDGYGYLGSQSRIVILRVR